MSLLLLLRPFGDSVVIPVIGIPITAIVPYPIALTGRLTLPTDITAIVPTDIAIEARHVQPLALTARKTLPIEVTP